MQFSVQISVQCQWHCLMTHTFIVIEAVCHVSGLVLCEVPPFSDTGSYEVNFGNGVWHNQSSFPYLACVGLTRVEIYYRARSSADYNYSECLSL